MINYTELKALAEAVAGLNKESGYPWEQTVSDGRLGKTSTAYALAASPATILSLISENERLNACRLDLVQQCNEVYAEARSAERTCDVWMGMVAAGVTPGIQALIAKIEALHQEHKGKALVPIEPPPGLLMSMAIRSDHGLGIPGYYDQPLLIKANYGVTHARLLELALSEMRKIHEEVVGTGFYSA